jgi:DNA invertase Pin-like site-specific DNA recombinase
MSNAHPSPTAYSYVRFSSKKQEERYSIRRQAELTAAWAKRNKVHLDTSLRPDRGISAFRGKNRDLGALGEFLRLVQNGRVLPGSFLVVESLDRLTREEIQPALLLILSLLQKGIRVVQLKPVETVYDAKSDTTPIILMLVELSRGHSESKVKSDRVSEAWGQRRKAARAGNGILTRKLPLWVEARDGKLVPIPGRAAVVRRIFELSAAGMGLYSIMTTLTREKVPAFGPSGRWSIAYLDLILKDRRAVGEFQPKLRGGKPDGPPINYFPAVVSEDLWERTRLGARQRHRPYRSEPGRRAAGRIGERVNVFQGLLKSARDGFSYVVGSTSTKNPHPTIRAAGHRLGVGRSESFPLESFEGAVLTCLKEIDPREVLNGDSVVHRRAIPLS